MVKSGSGRKRRAVAETTVELDAEGEQLALRALPCLHQSSAHPANLCPASLMICVRAAEDLGAAAAIDDGGAQPSRHSSQPNPYFDEEDEELQTYENEARVLYCRAAEQLPFDGLRCSY
jgi:hypothetical protein